MLSGTPTSSFAVGDHAPQISGVAATTATVGQSYSFQPSATDADGDVLTFSVSGAPSWLALNAATGRLSGTPTNADVGVDTGIVVQVSDGKATVSLAPFTITVAPATSTAGGNGGGTGGGSGGTGISSVDLAWVPPTENTDGFSARESERLQDLLRDLFEELHADDHDFQSRTHELRDR